MGIVHFANFGLRHVVLSGYFFNSSFQLLTQIFAVLNFLFNQLISEPRGGPADPDHFDACNAIYSGQPFVMPIKNVTLFQGSSARINCNVVNQGYSAYEKVNCVIIVL